MSRLQINDNFGGERLQTAARPIAATEQVAQPVEDTRWKALANVFAGGAGLAETARQKAEDDEAAAAKKWAQSMTVSELGKQIDAGHMMPSQSPIFVGTVQHIWGVNSHEAMSRDITSKMSTGELAFSSPGEADAHLTEARNSILAGQSKYAIAGFDKGYAQLREGLMATVKKTNDKASVDNAQVQATDFLANGLNTVTSKSFKGTPAEAAQEVVAQYQLMSHTRVMPRQRRGRPSRMSSRAWRARAIRPCSAPSSTKS